MALSLEKFATRLVESGVLSRAELSAFRTQNNPVDVEQLARGLVKQKLLTAYQAQQVFAGKAKALTMGNYLILDKLGQGGMGMVLKARHKRMNRVVALKLLSPTVVKSPEMLARFHREVQAAARLEHQNIVIAHDADEANGTHFFVMQYVEGADLSALVRKNGPLPVDQAIDYVIQAARGLEFAHKCGVIHRDIKPANLLLDIHGTVKVLDMGLARIQGETGTDAELTSTGAVMGTVDYMAPEQALNTKSADARSDVYSLGITLWYLLTARPAYEGDSLTARLMAHANSPVPSLKSTRADIPDHVDAVYQKMVAKKATDRFQTMTEVLAALERFPVPRTSPAPFALGGSAGPSEDSQLSEMLALFGAGADPMAVTRSVLAAQTEMGSIHASDGSEFDQTVTSGTPEGETDPTTLTSLTSIAGPQPTRRSPSRLWQQTRTQVAAGLAAVALLIVSVVATVRQGGPPSSGPVADDAEPSSVTPGVPTPPKIASASGTNPMASPQSGPSAALRFSLAYDGTIRARVPSLDLDRIKPFTIEAWATPQATFPNGSGIVFLSPASGLGIHNDRWTLMLEDLGSVWAEKPFEQNRRVHVAGVRSEKELILFVDGDVAARAPIEPKPFREPANFYMGTFLQYGYKGLIDEVRVSSGVRYPREFTPADRFDADGQTIALYHFDEGQGSEIRDSSGNGHHGFVDNEKYERVADATWIRMDSGLFAKTGDPKDGVKAGGAPAAVSATVPTPAHSPFRAEQARAHQNAWAEHLGVPVDYTNSIGMKFVLIPPGEFLMGSSPEEVAAVLKPVPQTEVRIHEMVRVEAPRRRVVLTEPFYLGVHEVTQQQYGLLMGGNPSHFAESGRGSDLVRGLDTKNLPVESVSWLNATSFCTALSKKERLLPWYGEDRWYVPKLSGTGYRLPTDAEWEFACRAGTTTTYWSGDEPDDVRPVAWCSLNAQDRTHSVGELPANPFGLHDIHGNVWEFVEDGWPPNPNDSVPIGGLINPVTTYSQKKYLAIRGGSWIDAPGRLHRSASHEAFQFLDAQNMTGIRLALSVDTIRPPTKIDSRVEGSPGVSIRTLLHGFEIVTPSYRTRVTPEGLLGALLVGDTPLIDCNTFRAGVGGMGVSGTVRVERAGMQLKFTQGSEYGLVYSFDENGFTVVATLDAVAAARDQGEGKAYYLTYSLTFSDAVTAVRSSNPPAEFSLPAVEPKTTLDFVAISPEGHTVSIQSPSTEAAFGYSGAGPRTWSHGHLVPGSPNSFRFDIRKAQSAKPHAQLEPRP